MLKRDAEFREQVAMGGVVKALPVPSCPGSISGPSASSPRLGPFLWARQDSFEGTAGASASITSFTNDGGSAPFAGERDNDQDSNTLAAGWMRNKVGREINVRLWSREDGPTEIGKPIKVARGQKQRKSWRTMTKKAPPTDAASEPCSRSENYGQCRLGRPRLRDGRVAGLRKADCT